MSELLDTNERQREHFNSISKRYATARAHPNHLLLKDLIWSRFLADKGPLAPPGMRVLEPMCGVGEGRDIIRSHLQPQIHYQGMDYSEQMVERARRERPGVRFDWQDVTRVELAADSFDWIVLIGGLHHVYAQAAQVIARLAHGLRRGGHFLSFEPTQNCALTRWVRRRIYARNSLFDAESEQGFDLPVLHGMFRAAGFVPVDEAAAGLLAYVLHYNPDAFPALNVGGARMVRGTFALDSWLWRSALGRWASFATITLWRLE